MLADNHIAIIQLWFHTLKDLCTPTALFEHLSLHLAFVQSFHVLPAIEEAWFVLLMKRSLHLKILGLP